EERSKASFARETLPSAGCSAGAAGKAGKPPGASRATLAGRYFRRLRQWSEHSDQQVARSPWRFWQRSSLRRDFRATRVSFCVTGRGTRSASRTPAKSTKYSKEAHRV